MNKNIQFAIDAATIMIAATIVVAAGVQLAELL